MRSALAFAALLGFAAATPAAAQDPPVFRKPPISGPVSGAQSCVEAGRFVQDGAVIRQTRRGGVTPAAVPATERVEGAAAETVLRPVLRTFVQIRIGAEAGTLPEAAAGLAAIRTRLAQALGAAGHPVIAVQTLNSQLDAPLPGRRPAGGSARIGLLVEGEVARPRMQGFTDASGGGAIERLEFDFANADAAAEDLRPGLERAARAVAAAQARLRGAVPADLLSSQLTLRGARRAGASRDAGALTVTASATFRMVPATAAGTQ